MKRCQSCGNKRGYTKFSAFVNGHNEELCKTCFFQHINAGSEKLAVKRGGNLSYEVVSSLFAID